jgi:predicted dehydrogenase
MAESIRVGILGAGWPGAAHAKGYKEAGGFKIVAVADLIPERRKKLMSEYGIGREFADAKELLADREIQAVSLCLPRPMHAPMAAAALKAGKHVLCEAPPATSLRETRQMESASTKAGKVLMYALQRRFGGNEQASRQAIDKGYAGDLFHARVSWMRARGIPIGTGWFTTAAQSGGGALLDLGIHMLDLAWHLMGKPRPISAFGATHQKFKETISAPPATMDVEDSAFALLKFDGGRTVELSTAWAFNQPPQQQGTVCRLYGEKAALDVYTPSGAQLYRNFDAKGHAKAVPLKPPKLGAYAAMMRHFKDCIHHNTPPSSGAADGVMLMQMIEAIYKSATSGKSVEIRER